MLKARIIGVVLVVLGLMALLVGLPPPAGAQEGAPELSVAQVASPFGPIQPMLSGYAWLVTSGLDPALGGNRGAALAGLAGGVQSPVLSPAAAVLVPYRDPSAKFSRNVLISQDFSQLPFQTEPSIAVNPKDPDHLVVGMIDYGFPNVTAYVSIDGGATWEGPFQPKYPRKELASAGDPVIQFDRQGNPYYAFISLDVKEFNLGNLIGSTVVSSISVSRSNDGGYNWEDAIPAATSDVQTQLLLVPGDPRTRGLIAFDFLDKPWMAIGPNPSEPDKDIIYVTYTKFTTVWQVIYADELPFLSNPTTQTVIELVRSEDGGATWSAPIQVSPSAIRRVAEGERQVVQGSQPAVAPDGTVYVAWLDSTGDDAFEGLAEIHVARSDDGGESFSRPIRAATFLEPPFSARNTTFRYWATAFPQIVTGPQGEVYIAFTALPPDRSNDDGDIYVVRSSDKGQTWSRRQRVNDDEAGHLQFFPAIATGPDGTLFAMWGDMRHDRMQTTYHIYFSKSSDQGQTWDPSSRVSDYPSNPNYAFPRGLFIGDYFSMRAVENDVYMVWADGRLGQFGPANQKIGFARQRLMPTPSVFISPPQGAGGRDVVLQGFGFQPERDVFIEVGGVVVSTGRTNSAGQFSSQIFVPISGQGAHPVRAIDASGNVAGTSFFMDFGFDDVQRVAGDLKGVAEQVQALRTRVGDADVSQQLGTLAARLDQLQKTVEQQASQPQGTSVWLLVAAAASVALLVLGIGAFVLMLVRHPAPATPLPVTNPEPKGDSEP